MADAENVDEVIARLDVIIAAATAQTSRLGFFAAMYRHVTARIRERILDGFFEDAERMSRFDAVFANRYFDALAIWQAGGTPTRSWKVAFEAAGRSDLTIMQHLLLGMNAHINLDLAIAAAEMCPGAALPGLRADFDRINVILAETLDDIEAVLRQFSPLYRLLRRFDATEDAIANFSMRAARDDAWQHAVLLAGKSAEQQQITTAVVDAKVGFLGRLIAEPGRALTAILDAIQLEESSDIPAIVAAFAA